MSGDCDSSHASEEVIENNKLREPLLEYSDDQQHFIGARSPLNTKPTPPEKKTNQCLLQ